MCQSPAEERAAGGVCRAPLVAPSVPERGSEGATCCLLLAGAGAGAGAGAVAAEAQHSTAPARFRTAPHASARRLLCAHGDGRTLACRPSSPSLTPNESCTALGLATTHTTHHAALRTTAPTANTRFSLRRLLLDGPPPASWSSPRASHRRCPAAVDLQPLAARLLFQSGNCSQLSPLAA
ncbi:hypothetical protein P171DRAFT_510590 [Karstenula rhodostoma CBS 690.94]|uniref:Uncharacterized protein n=1 Tax=Karstenula rhodostoma CBS 690.94 TaxID=1392251 RepID=A0A9P4PPU6_9PLEO|nr:hypothetical protein P171DRAFT_510590 [Karstenula rhodostoma CBS 690.94]